VREPILSPTPHRGKIQTPALVSSPSKIALAQQLWFFSSCLEAIWGISGKVGAPWPIIAGVYLVFGLLSGKRTYRPRASQTWFTAPETRLGLAVFVAVITVLAPVSIRW
jgi:hypothetical protein